MFSALEVVPLTLLTLDAWDFVRTTRGEGDSAGDRHPAQWTFYFLMAVGFWNFVGAGMFGLPDQHADRELLRGRHHPHANHGHAALHGRLRHAGDRADGVRAARDQRPMRSGPGSRST